MSYESLIYEKTGHIATVTLNRPESLNAWGGRMSAEVLQVFDEMAADDDVRVTILTGAGRGFCSGQNVKDPNAHVGDPVIERMMQSEGRPLFPADYPKPLIGAVNGPAYGAGLNLVLCCDFVLASTAARFCFPMSRLGIFPLFPGAQTLAVYVGKVRAAEMALMARSIDGEEAARWGLANRCVAPEALMDEARTWAAELARMSPVSLRKIKDDLRESYASHFNRQLNQLRAWMAQTTEDSREGHNAWREKRAPIFTGR